METALSTIIISYPIINIIIKINIPLQTDKRRHNIISYHVIHEPHKCTHMQVSKRMCRAQTSY